MAHVIDELTVETTLVAPTSATTTADIAAAVAAHVAASDPHANYETTTELNARDTANRARSAHTGTQTSSTISDFGEAAQDAVGGILIDTTTIDFNYSDAGATITANVIPGGVDHNALLNGGGNTHINHASVSITAGTSLNGGGDITTTRTLNHNTFGTAGTYGSASTVPVFTTESTGHISSVAATAISILSSAVSNFASTVLSTVLSGFSATVSAITSSDTILQAFGKAQGQINDLQSQIDVWTENIVTSDVTNSSSTTFVNITDLAMPVVSGRKYYLEYAVRYRTATAGTGFAITLNTSDTADGEISALVNLPTNGGDGTGNLFTGSITSLGDVVTSNAVQSSNTDYICNIKGIFNCTTTGTLVPQFRSESNGNQVTARDCSVCLIREFV